MRMILLLIFLTGAGCTPQRYVYVCDSPNAKRYHLTKNCRGLVNCTYRIIKVTQKRAVKEGDTLCHYENL